MKTFFRASTQLFLGLSLLFCIASCSDSPADIIKKKNPELKKTLDNLNAVAARVSDQALGMEKILLPPAKAPVIDLNDIGSYAYEGTSNMQLFTTQDLLDPEAKSPGMHLFPSRTTWQTVKAMVKDGKFPKSEKESLEALKGLSNWRFAVVIKARSVQAPQIASQPISGKVTDHAVYSSGAFTGGFIEGDVLMYDLDNTGFLGGFPFSAKSSENVESTTYGGSNSSNGLQNQLDRDFTEQIKKAVLYGMLDRLPNDRVYMNGNLRQRVLSDRSKMSE